MHSSTSKKGTAFHFNGDFSGDVTIISGENTMKIPCDDLLEFVAYNYLLNKQIARLEKMSWSEIIKEQS